MRIVQIAPEIGPGSGVAGVAYNLEQEFQRRGVATSRFTLTEARGSWIPTGGSGLAGRLAHALRVVWFSTVGTVLARRHLAKQRDAVSLCHNDALAGDVYVNHGILQAAMRSRGHFVWRMVRNPVHLFTTVRDKRRYAGGTAHHLVVNLTSVDDALLRATYPKLRLRTSIIGNGVDTGRFALPSDAQRGNARRSLGLADGDVAVVFIGHEFERKGLPVLLTALHRLPGHVRLVVVGGTPDMVATARSDARTLGVDQRVHFVGEVSDPRPFLHAGDVLALPSAYEAFPLVVLEALASGLPVVASATGCIPDVVDDGVNGFVVSIDAESVAAAISRLMGLPRSALAEAARATAERHTWASVAEQYLDVLAEVRKTSTSGPAT